MGTDLLDGSIVIAYENLNSILSTISHNASFYLLILENCQLQRIFEFVFFIKMKQALLLGHEIDYTVLN